MSCGNETKSILTEKYDQILLVPNVIDGASSVYFSSTKALTDDEFINYQDRKHCTDFEFLFCSSYQARVCVNGTDYFNPHYHRYIHRTDPSNGGLCSTEIVISVNGLSN